MKPIAEVIKSNLKAEMARREITPEEMWLNMDIGRTAWYSRMKEPGMFTIEQLDKGARLMHMKLEQLVRREA